MLDTQIYLAQSLIHIRIVSRHKLLLFHFYFIFAFKWKYKCVNIARKFMNQKADVRGRSGRGDRDGEHM